MPNFLHKPTLNHRILILQPSLCPSSFTNQHSITGYLFYNDRYAQVPSQTNTQSQDTYSTTIALPKFLHKPTLTHRILILQRSLCPSSFTNQHSITGYLFYNHRCAQVSSQNKGQSCGYDKCVALNFDICNDNFQEQRFLECRKHSATQCRSVCFKQWQVVRKSLLLYALWSIITMLKKIIPLETTSVSRTRLSGRILTLRRLMSYIYIYIYIYGAPILDVSRSHTTTQHSR